MLESILRDLAYLLMPPDVFLVLIAVLFPFCRINRVRRWLLSLLLVVSVMSVPALAKLAQLSLMQVPKIERVENISASAYDAIVVLGGGIFSDDEGGYWLGKDSSRRAAIAKSAAERTGLPVILSGGNPDSAFPSEAETMMRQMSFPATTILETGSMNTYENAVNTKFLLEKSGWKRVLLVTSETHLLRSYTMFRAANVDVPGMLAADNTTEISLSDLLPSVTAFWIWRQILKEYIGICWYLLNGNISFSDLP